MTDANRLSDAIFQEIGHLKLNYIDESEEELIEEVRKVLEKHMFYLRNQAGKFQCQ